MPKLVIVESPAKAKTIAAFLGSKYRVEASYGHVRDLPKGRADAPEEIKGEKWAEYGVNTEDAFQPYYLVPEEKKRQIRLLKDALKDADELLLATDEDREGESISWHLLEVLKPKVPVCRIVFHEITREAIRNAVANPRQVDMDLVHAQESRRILDRLFGYKLSPVLWRKIQPGLSAGRVQSAAVRLLVEREEERRAFVSAVYWDLQAEITAGSSSFKATLQSLGGQRLALGKDFEPTTGKPNNTKAFVLDETRAVKLREELGKNLPWRVSSTEEKPAKQRPYPPFTTSTLQQEASRKLGYSAKRTMQIAQKLYEGVDMGSGERVGVITYMRTDSVSLSDKALQDAQKVIRTIYGADFAQGPRPYKTKQRNAQEAHEAIRPTELSNRPQDLKEYLEKDEAALYELIWKRTLASQMPDAELLRTSVEIEAATKEFGPAIFNASGKRIVFPGFLRAYVEGSDDPAAELGDQEVVLPTMVVGDKIHKAPHAGLAMTGLDALKHETQPPARYTEASLVKKLEEEGIGRPSTYASIMTTIMERGYTFANKSKQLVPTFVAVAVIDLLRRHFPEYVDIQFTARMEEELDQIAGGTLGWVLQLQRFFRGTGDVPGLEAVVEAKQSSISFPDIELGKDPGTGAAVRLRVGKFGPYLARGENGNAQMADVPAEMAPADLTLAEALRLLNQKAAGPRVVGVHPTTGENIYAMTGRFGDYVQLGETPEDKSAPKPRRASLPKGTGPAAVTLEEALTYLALPRDLGIHPDKNAPIMANNGRYGPYVGCDGEFRSLKAEDDVYTISFDRALQLLREPKQGRAQSAARSQTVLKDFGKTDKGVTVRVLEGRYGSYVSDGETNATVPKGEDIENLSLEKALALLEARAGSTKKKKPARGTAAKKATAPKTTAKKATAKAPKAAAKKAAPKAKSKKA